MKFLTIALGIICQVHLIPNVLAHSIPPPLNSNSTCATSLEVISYCGKPHPPTPLRNETSEAEGVPGPPVPTAVPSGDILPSSPAVNLTRFGNQTFHFPSLDKRACGGRDVRFNKTTLIGEGGQPSEPSGAKANNVIFTTANFYAAVSVDNGATFHNLDPTVYSGPGDDTTGPFCCDQIVEYVPQINRFVWLIQFWPNEGGNNKLRLISFHPEDVDTSGINDWIYMDIASTTFSDTHYLDAGDLTVANGTIYVSATVNSVGLVVIRVPLSGLDVPGSMTIWYTDPSVGGVAYLSRIAQNAVDTAFWAGHSVYGNTVRVFKWPESGTTYFWSDIRINDWPTNSDNFVSTCPGSDTSWAFKVSAGTIIGATRRNAEEVWFAWPAPSGSGFPNLHVQVIQINPVNWPNLGLIKQWQIWNPNFAFNYPGLYTDDCGDVGIAVAFGGGPFFPSSAVGVADGSGILASTVWYPTLSDICEDRWGDYLTVRANSPDASDFVAFVYSLRNDSGSIARDTRYIQFGRT